MNHLPPLDYRRPWVWGVPAAAATLLLLVLALDVDVSLFHLINGLGPATSPALWANITVLGDGLVIFAISLLFAGRRPELLWALLLTGLVGLLLVHGLKESISAYRPPRILGVENIFVIGPAHVAVSFPSGHTATAFAFAGLLAQWQRLHLSYRWILLGLAVGVAASRVVVGVHWPVDVLGGAFVGWVAAIAGYTLARRLAWGTRIGVQRAIALLLLGAVVQLIVAHDSGYAEARITEIGLGVTVLILALPGLRRLFRPAGSAAVREGA